MKKNTYSKVQLNNVLFLIPSVQSLWYPILWSCNTVDYKIFAHIDEAYIASILQKKQTIKSGQIIDFLDIDIYPKDIEDDLSKTGEYMLMSCAHRYYDNLISQNMSKYDKLLVRFGIANSKETISISNLDDQYEDVYKDNPYSGFQYSDDRSAEIIEKGILSIAKVSLENVL
jgi:hypothetical protein